jgi:hypothetical protein
MTQQTHYPSFRVMDEKDAWDDHTQSIVDARLSSPPRYEYLNEQEVDMLSAICPLLVDDASPDVLSFILGHIDQTLHSSPGESQRKVGVPAGKDLIRQGLQALDKSAASSYSGSFVKLNSEAQKQLLQKLSGNKAEPASAWTSVPQQPLFQKLLNLTIESYCSHPKVWSEIGYAGPAYPRGYVRAQLGQLDPWEAKTER